MTRGEERGRVVTDPAEKSFQVSAANGDLSAVLHLPGDLPAPVIICCHGLLSSKDSPKFIALGKAFARAGWAAVRFDFAGCGNSRALPRRELVQSRMSDLEAVVRLVEGAPWRKGPVGLMGSSMGGYISLLTAAACKERVQGVVTWASPFDLSELHFNESREDHWDTLSSVFPSGFELGAPRRLEGLEGVSGALVIHGQEDEVVPWLHAVRIHEGLGEPRRLCLFKNGDHRLLDAGWRRKAVELSVEWFGELGFPMAAEGVSR